MPGPSVKRSPVNTAPLQGLTDPLQNLLQGFLQSGGQLPQSFNQPSDLQRTTSNAFSSLLNQGNPGQGVIDATQPIFQRNMQLGADTLRQAGPRFNSNTERLIGQQGQGAMQDFNAFSAGVLQQGQQQQLANLMGAGGYANQMQAPQDAFRQQLLGMSGQLGAGPAALFQDPGTLSKILGLVGTAGAVAGAIPTGGASLGALPATTGMAGGNAVNTSFKPLGQNGYWGIR